MSQRKNIFADIINKVMATVGKSSLPPPITFIIALFIFMAMIMAAPLLIGVIIIYLVYRELDKVSLMSKEELNNHLYEAIHEEDIKKIKKILSKGAEVNSLDIQGKTFLHLAIEKNNSEIVKCLLKNNATVDMVDKFYGCTPLYLAVKKDYIHIIQILFEYNADPNIPDIRGNSPLALAVSNNRINIVELLLLQKSDPNTKDIFNETPINIAIFRGNIEIALHLLNTENIILDVTNKDKQTPLHSAINKGHGYEEIIEKILSKQKSILNNQDNNGNTALHLCVRNDNIHIIEILLSYGAKIDITNKYMKKAVDYSKSDEARRLLIIADKMQKLCKEFYLEFDKKIMQEIIPGIKKAVINIDEGFVDSNKLIPDLPASVWPEIISRAFPKQIKDFKLKTLTIQTFITKIIENIFENVCMQLKQTEDGEHLSNELKYLADFIKIQKDHTVLDRYLRLILENSFDRFPTIISNVQLRKIEK